MKPTAAEWRAPKPAGASASRLPAGLIERVSRMTWRLDPPAHSARRLVLGLVTFVQMLYLESLRLRTRDLPALQFFKRTLEDKIGFDTEDGAGSFTLVKHTALLLLGDARTCLVFADGQAWTLARSASKPSPRPGSR